MSNRIYNINKVVSQIGLENQINYDSIEIYIDIANNNNIWARVFITDFSKNKPEQREEIKFFSSNNEMLAYVRSHFNSYELDHPVDLLQKHIFFHYVNYTNIVYNQHANSNNDYLMLNYREFINGEYESHSEKFNKEDEQLVYNIFKTSKRLPLNMPIDSRYISYQESENNRVKRSKLNEVNLVSKNISTKKKGSNIKIIMSTAMLATLLAGGIKLVSDVVETEDILSQDNSKISRTDMNIFFNKKKAGEIINQLMDENYENITDEEISYIRGYIRDVELSNYDYNDSTNMFNLDSYFNDKIFFNRKDSSDLTALLVRINKLYKSCFNTINGQVVLSQEAANKYISYVLSLVFMYDTTVDLRGSGQVPMNNQSVTSPYATKDDITNYESFPVILKYIIANQLSTMISHTDYTVEREPSNYYGKLDKYSLNNELEKHMNLMLDELYFQVNYGNKTI